MFDQVDEPSFRLDVAGLSDPFEVLAFTGSEAISEPFAFEIDLLIDDPQLDLAGLLHRAAYLSFGAGENGVHGHLQSLVQHEHGDAARLCRVRLGARLNCLALRFSQRIFSARSVPQILRQVLKEHGIAGAQCRFELSAEYPVQAFCTQYRESDLAFMQRICARARIHFRFEHTRSGHCLIFGDDPAHLPEARMVRLDADADDGNHVQRWHVRSEVQTSGQMSSQSPTAEGHTRLSALRAGQWLSVRGHPFSECNGQWLLNRIEHHADQSREPPYSNRIFCNGSTASLVTTGLTRPRMQSLQRAWVVTVDEPRPDLSRPVAVQFDWLYQGEGAAPSHCWLPLAPALANTSQAMLRDGVEVVVSFFEGDPDQPLISGVLQRGENLHEAVNEAPIRLPDTLLSEGLPQLLKSAEPLLLLCLIPGGGSFNHCPEAVCSCRLITALDPSGGR
ncbi:type VI secretion protein [Pseudomonas syringae]|nr:type VI secretion protein [Pseudomonas syringae]MCF5070405.1 type VI secretion protein [Pseudomonas syringae]